MAFNYGDDRIDCSDIEDRIVELENESGGDLENFDGEAELANLQDVIDTVLEYAGETDGVTLIRNEDFKDYVKEMLLETDSSLDSLPNYIVINWEATAENIRHDYTSVELNGTTYYF